MIDRHDSPEETPGANKISYPVPNPTDLVVIEYVDQKPAHYKPLELDSPHAENARLGLTLRLAWQGPSSSNPDQMIRIYTSGRTNQDVYNYALNYSAESNAGPIFVRSYLERRDSYAALPKGQPLTGVTNLRLTNGGSGYTTPPTIAISGDGTGATAIAVLFNGAVQSIRLTSEGVGYTAATIAFSGGGGSGAAALAGVQPASALLVKEDLLKLTAEIGELFSDASHESMLGGLYVRVVRVYETLPGPWVPFSRWDDNLGSIFGHRRAVLTSLAPQQAISTATSKTTYEAREGSAIVSMETFESWGDNPYAHEFTAEIPDRIPAEFRDLLPLLMAGQTEVGQAAPPILAPGELAATSREVNKFWRHETRTRRDLTLLPITRHDFDLDGIQAGGSEFGGVFDNARTLAETPLDVEEGFTIIKSSVRDLGNDLKFRETKRLTGTLPARLQLTNGGNGFSSPPAVVFGAGNAGSDAAAHAVLSTAPVIPPEGEPGGLFTLNMDSLGDAKGVFYFLGARYNGGVWRSPATAGNIGITAHTSPTYPQTAETLAVVVDRQAQPQLAIITDAGGSHYLAFDIGVGKTLKANRLTIRQADNLTGGTIMRNLRVVGFNEFVSGGTVLGPDIPIPQTNGEWSQGELDDSVGYRYFMVFGTDGPIPNLFPDIWPALVLSEIELYGELTIVPGLVKQYSFDGDTHGVFYDLGARGNGGVWRNPQTAGDIVCDVDDLVFGTLDALVDRAPSNIGGKAFYFDLKEGRSLICTKISYRQRTSSDAVPCDVQFEGTNTLGPTSDWATLANFITPSAEGSWLTTDVPGATSYRRFRIISPTNAFRIGELELYGSLTFPPDVLPDPSFAVERIDMDAFGTDYAVPPAVLIEGGGGTGATGTAVLNDTGNVISVLITNHGSGYTSIPTVSFSTIGRVGSGAAATSIIDGQVTDVIMEDFGSGYSTPPLITFGFGTGGSGAAADAILAFVLESIGVDNGGSGYTIPPDVIITPDNGAVAHAVLTGDVVTSIVIDDSGGLFETPPVISFSGDGTDAAATPVLAATGLVVRAVITNPGSGYQGPPDVGISGDGSGAAAVSAIEGVVTGFNLVSGGENYDVAPGVLIPGGATATANVSGGAVTDLVLGDPGASYTEPPPVVFTSLGGPEAEATIAYGVDHIDVTAGGDDYPIAPPVQIIGDGRSASARSILGRGIDRIEVIAPGDGYAATSLSAVISGPDGNGGAVATVQRSFGIESATVTNPGSSYESDPVVTAPSPEGIDAIFRAIRGLPLRDVVMRNGGIGYTTPPTVGFVGSAAGDAILGFGVDSVAMDSMGAGYQTAPQVELRSNGSGGGATAIAELLGRTVASILVDNGGTGYTTAPTIVIGDGSNATAHAVVAAGVITSIVIDDPGTGYLVAPEIFIGNDGGGAGAHAIASLTPGQDIRIVVTNPGAGYETAPSVILTQGGGTGAAATATLLSAGSVKRVVLSNVGADYVEDTPVAFSGGGGANADALGVRDLAASGPVALIAVLQPGDGYIASTVACIITGGGGTGAAATAVKKTLGSIKSVTVTDGGADFEDPPVVTIGQAIGGIGSGAILRAILKPTGSVKRVEMTGSGEGYTEAPTVSFPATDGSNASATAFLTDTGSIETLTLTVPGGPFSVAPLVSFVPTGDEPLATAVYLLPQIWPTLIDELTDPTDKLIVRVVKDIVPYGTALPPGYSEMRALNKYRSIQMVSSIDLTRLPPVETYLTTQHVGLPNQLLAVLPVWSTSGAQSTSSDAQQVTGGASATAEISGAILVLKTGGFRGAALARVERVHFKGVPPDSAVPPITIIRPSTGTAFIKGGQNFQKEEGGTVNQQPLNYYGQPAQLGDLMGYDAGGHPIYLSGFSIIPRATSASNSLSSRVQIVDISDVLTNGINTASVNGVVEDSSSGVIHVEAAIEGSFGVTMPASCPGMLQPGSAILQEVGVEKRRFDLYVRTIVYVIVPGMCEAVGGDSSN